MVLKVVGVIKLDEILKLLTKYIVKLYTNNLEVTTTQANKHSQAQRTVAELVGRYQALTTEIQIYTGCDSLGSRLFWW